ncbi:uncharacterized protein LOC109705234, partial [Ananas comosus]|uniref:Uncharacterized protein LOC109705234 n=1 Tax=Ananas comosus TaxID=4615 RepID=A0A6P5EDX9_ANACO
PYARTRRTRLKFGATSTSRRGAVRARTCYRSIARRPGEGVFSSFSTPCRNWSRWLRILSSTVSISARTRRRSIGFRRDLVRWNRDFETKILSPRSRFLEQVPASTFRILAHSLRRSVEIQRNLGHWIRDFEMKLQDPCLLNLDKVSLVGFNVFFAARSCLRGKRELGFVADVAPRSRSSILPSSCCCEEVGRVVFFAIFDVVLLQ